MRENLSISEKLPKIVRDVLGTFRGDYIEEKHNRDGGDSGGFLRWLIRKKMEDEGRVPPKSDDE